MVNTDIGEDDSGKVLSIRGSSVEVPMTEGSVLTFVTIITVLLELSVVAFKVVVWSEGTSTSMVDNSKLVLSVSSFLNVLSSLSTFLVVEIVATSEPKVIDKT